MRPDATEDMTGCGDSSCIIARPLGMHTNGGCRCLKSIDDRRARSDIQRTIAGLRREVSDLRNRLAAKDGK
jgi:hypothetical protein